MPERLRVLAGDLAAIALGVAVAHFAHLAIALRRWQQQSKGHR